MAPAPSSLSARLLPLPAVTAAKLVDAPPLARGYYEARPGDVAGRSHVVLIDVREEAELLDALGHICGAQRQVPPLRSRRDPADVRGNRPQLRAIDHSPPRPMEVAADRCRHHDQGRHALRASAIR